MSARSPRPTASSLMPGSVRIEIGPPGTFDQREDVARVGRILDVSFGSYLGLWVDVIDKNGRRFWRTRGPAYGDARTHESPGACADRLEEIALQGFSVPEWILRQLREEAVGSAKD